VAKRKPVRREASAESRGAEVATVTWMMSVMSTALCAGVAGLIWLFAGDHPGAERVRLFAALLHFGAFVSAVVSLVLLAVVLKVRSEQPPAAVIAFAVVVALATIAAAFAY
jgi:hypothetical protein